MTFYLDCRIALAYAILERPVVNAKHKEMLEEWERTGRIFLRRESDGVTTVVMPPIFLYVYEREVHLLPSALRDIFKFATDVSWGEWEQFNACYEEWLNNTLIELGIDTISLGELYRGACATAATRNIKVKLKQLMVKRSTNQFPVSKVIVYVQ